MSEVTSSVTLPNTLQELDQIIQKYLSSDLRGEELLSLWQVIRDASLNQKFSEPDNDKVIVEHSY